MSTFYGPVHGYTPFAFYVMQTFTRRHPSVAYPIRHQTGTTLFLHCTNLSIVWRMAWNLPKIKSLKLTDKSRSSRLCRLKIRNYWSMGFMVGNKILLSPSCPMPLCRGSKLAQYSIRETFFIRLVSSCAVLFASKVVEKL